MSGDDVAFEVNHPGGICWGAGTGLSVTPDIQPNDVVSMRVGGSIVGATTTLDTYANNAVQNGTTVVVTGHVGSGIDLANVEQRIIEPALVDTAVGKRDVRAVPGPLTAAPKGGYSSSLEFDTAAHTFTATYIFDNQSDATIAANAGLGERAMAWELTDADGNRQGMTIAENGEPGGPGMGGCPNGPLQSGPPGPSNVAAVNVSSGVKVNWMPAVAIPGTPAILGYRVTATADSTSNSEQVEIGKRITNPTAKGTTITGLAAGETYNISVVSFSSVGETFPAVQAIAQTDVTRPTVSASPNGGSYAVAQQVTLSANEVGADIYYTLDGSAPVSGDQLGTPEPLHYDGPISITSSTTLKFAAFDPSNNVSDIVTEQYAITNDPVPTAPAFSGSSVGYGTVTLGWAPADPGAPGLSIVDYQVKVFSDAAATSLVQTVTTNGPTNMVTVSGLTGDTPYWFTVAAKNNANSAFGAASAPYGPLTPQGAVVANAGPDQTGVVRNTKVTLSGAGSTVTGATYTWTQLVTGTSNPMPAGVDKVTLSPVTGQPRDATFTLPFYKYPMTNAPLTFRLTVTVGGTTKTDDVVIVPGSDTVTITSAKFKVGDFRVIGTSSTVGATMTMRSATGTVWGTAPVIVGGTYDIRNRTGSPATNPGMVYVDSNMGGTAGPFPIAQG